ncbi:hypothetical protein [Enterobacter sp. PTB]|uniref:hypothetical protein n=1 Tax=Enterobacter sp. PTB TaxID=3143437 RepID=UPI003DAA1629
MITVQGRIFRSRNEIEENHLVIPFIGKGIGDAVVIGGAIDTLVKNNYRVSIIADKRTHFLFKEWSNLESLYFYDTNNKKQLINGYND